MDAVVIGAGPNGLVAAAKLARAGQSVLLLEAQPRIGGALWSEPFTRPGFIHDVGAAFFPFAYDSPPLRELNLGEVGLSWAHATRESCHPAPDGSCATICRDVERSVASFGIDGPAGLVGDGEWQPIALTVVFEAARPAPASMRAIPQAMEWSFATPITRPRLPAIKRAGSS